MPWRADSREAFVVVRNGGGNATDVAGKGRKRIAVGPGGPRGVVLISNGSKRRRRGRVDRNTGLDDKIHHRLTAIRKVESTNEDDVDK